MALSWGGDGKTVNSARGAAAGRFFPCREHRFVYASRYASAIISLESIHAAIAKVQLPSHGRQVLWCHITENFKDCW